MGCVNCLCMFCLVMQWNPQVLKENWALDQETVPILNSIEIEIGGSSYMFFYFLPGTRSLLQANIHQLDQKLILENIKVFLPGTRSALQANIYQYLKTLKLYLRWKFPHCKWSGKIAKFSCYLLPPLILISSVTGWLLNRYSTLPFFLMFCVQYD